MNAAFLETQLVAYLSLREALGFQMRAEKILLPDFVAFVKAQGITGPIRAQLAFEWACQTSASRGPSGGRAGESSARLVTPAHLIHADRSVGQYWTTGGRGDPLTNRSCPAGA